MSRYPDDPRPISPHNFRTNQPAVSGGPEWAPQGRTLTRFSLGEADVEYRGKSFAQIMVLNNFFNSVGGPAGRFTFVDFNGCGVPGSGVDPGVAWTGLYVAKGDGVATVFDLPTYHVNASPLPAVYENGVSKTVAIGAGGSAYRIDLGGGTDGVDKLTAAVAPAASVIITIDATCRRAYRRARFSQPKLPFVLNVPANYYQGVVTILEVRK